MKHQYYHWAEPALFITVIFLHHGNNWDNVTLYCHPALQLSIISSNNRKYKLTIMIKVELKLSFNPLYLTIYLLNVNKANLILSTV